MNGWEAAVDRPDSATHYRCPVAPDGGTHHMRANGTCRFCYLSAGTILARVDEYEAGRAAGARGDYLATHGRTEAWQAGYIEGEKDWFAREVAWERGRE